MKGDRYIILDWPNAYLKTHTPNLDKKCTFGFSKSIFYDPDKKSIGVENVIKIMISSFIKFLTSLIAPLHSYKVSVKGDTQQQSFLFFEVTAFYSSPSESASVSNGF